MIFKFLYKKIIWNYILIILAFVFIRFSKGVYFIDAYSYFIQPFWPGIAQKEWLENSNLLEKQIRINLLEKDNLRLRKLLSLQSIAKEEKISAVVISRKLNGWWQQLELNKGINHGIEIGDSVVAPGGLIGIINSVSPVTSRVKLLTAPGSKVGAWIDRIQHHGILIGMGTNRTKFSFLHKDYQAKVGDVVSTSPASTIVPPNLPIGIIKHINSSSSSSASFAIIQLLASPEAIDWVQVLKI